MLATELELMHLLGVASVFLIPKFTELLTVAFKALVWKFGGHLNKGDLVTINKEQAQIMSCNLTGLHVKYTEDGKERTISVSKLDALDVRK